MSELSLHSDGVVKTDEQERDFAILPVDAFAETIVAHVRQHQLLICVGETGSGDNTHWVYLLMEFLINCVFKSCRQNNQDSSDLFEQRTSR